MKIGVIASGDLGFNTLKYICNNYHVLFVLTDSKSNNIIHFCSINKIEFFVGNPRLNFVDQFLKNKSCEILISINYLFLIEKKIINLASGLSFNIHGSLLPKYRGRAPHIWAIINNEKNTGITAHIIDEGCDTGPILDQIVIEIDDNETGSDILNKFKFYYVSLVDKVLNDYKNNKLQITLQDEKKATYFRKRTPNDGLINWNWHAERICNWVRALSNPYPGAFCFYETHKIIIDKVLKSDFGFNDSIQNGTIISTKPLIVKCENSAIEIILIRNPSVNFELLNFFY